MPSPRAGRDPGRGATAASALSAGGPRSRRVRPVGARPRAATAGGLRERRAFTDRPPVSARLPVSYHWVPGWARAIAARTIGGWNRRRVDRWAAFPGWPLDLSADVLDDLRDHAIREPPGRIGLTPV